MKKKALNFIVVALITFIFFYFIIFKNWEEIKAFFL